jgi:hypothetical protein
MRNNFMLDLALVLDVQTITGLTKSGAKLDNLQKQIVLAGENYKNIKTIRTLITALLETFFNLFNCSQMPDY